MYINIEFIKILLDLTKETHKYNFQNKMEKFDY